LAPAEPALVPVLVPVLVLVRDFPI